MHVAIALSCCVDGSKAIEDVERALAENVGSSFYRQLTSRNAHLQVVRQQGGAHATRDEPKSATVA